MSGLRILAVAGCRPNFVKLGPLMAAMRRRAGIHPVLVHTGQHYDAAMSGVFFRDLGLPEPDVSLGAGSGSHAVQTARVMEAIEAVLLDQRPDLVLVVGDVNSTVATALTAIKLGFPVAHVEAGLRSGDRQMPEEINRIVTDSVSDLLFATEPGAVENLAREGTPASSGKVFLVGNVMVDALAAARERIGQSDVIERLGLEERGYGVLTLHRPDNVEDEDVARDLVDAVVTLARDLPIVFPVHPRTRGRFHAMGLWPRLEAAPGVRVTEPCGYLDFLKLVSGASLVLTDSGGLQEESTVFGVPCLTLREGTERPITVEQGTNRIVGTDPARILSNARQALSGDWPVGRVPDLWDGHASERILDVIEARERDVRALHQRLRRRTIGTPQPVAVA